MAEGGEDTRDPPPRVLTDLKLPVFNCKAHNPQLEWEIFEAQITFILKGMEIPKKKWYLYITQQCGKEGWEWWGNSISAQVDKTKPEEVFRTFKKGFEVTETYWTYRQMYLSNIGQGHNESAAAFMTRVKDLSNSGLFMDGRNKENRVSKLKINWIVSLSVIYLSGRTQGSEFWADLLTVSLSLETFNSFGELSYSKFIH